jgi:cytochrome c
LTSVRLLTSVRRCLGLLIGLSLVPLIAMHRPSLAQDLRGHGGPVRAIAVSQDGSTILTGGFDESVIRWSTATGAALAVLRGHAGSVNAVVSLSGGRLASAGQDGRILLWDADSVQFGALEGHGAPVSSLAVSPDGRMIASASWDQTVRIWPLAGGKARLLEGHSGNVNAVAFAPDGRVISAGYDGTVRIWPENGPAEVASYAIPFTALAIAPDGEILAGAVDGKVRFLSANRALAGELDTGGKPVVALGISKDGVRLAVGTIDGRILLIERASRRVIIEVTGAGSPLWSLAFLPDGSQILTGSGDRAVRRWDGLTGAPLSRDFALARDDIPPELKNERGAQVFSACAACHTVTPNGGPRAGPPLHGLFGRRIATAPGYHYSEALKKLSIVWTPETVSKLFEVGPSTYTPGTKMPEQVVSASDRKSLIDFLLMATKPSR